MREVMKKLGKELDEAVDVFGENHKLVARTRRRLSKARATITQEREDRNPNNHCKDYAL